MAYNASVNVTQLKEDSPTGRGDHNAYLNVDSPYGGIEVWCSANQIAYFFRSESIIRLVVFRDEACAQEWLKAQKERYGEDCEISKISKY